MIHQHTVTFYGLHLQVSNDTFIPYPESEALVELAIQLNPKTVLDIGTGIGNIAISIAKQIPEVKVRGIDIAEKELKLAEENARLFKVTDRVSFAHSNLLDIITTPAELFIGNLPFIPTPRIPFLEKIDESVSSISLDGGEDGFDIYRQLFLQMIQKNLYPKFLIAEIDYTHQFLAITETHKYFPKAKVAIHTDRHRKIMILLIAF